MNTVIYYPHVYPSPQWLKMAALCWDEVYTLVPPEHPHPSEEIEKLDTALGGILKTFDVTRVVSEDLVEDFKSWVKAREAVLKARGLSSQRQDRFDLFFRGKFVSSIDDFLVKHGIAREEISSRENYVPQWEIEPSEEDENGVIISSGASIETVWTPPLPKPGSDHEKYEKLLQKACKKWNLGDGISADALEAEANKIRQDNLVKITNHDKFIYLPKDIGLHYLSLCASKIAKIEKRDLAADGEQFTDVVFHEVEALRGEVTTSVLKAHLPKDIANIEASRIAEVRSELAINRLRYLHEIQSLVNELKEIASEGQLNKLKAQILEMAEQRIEDTKKSYKHAKLDIAIKSFGMTLAPPAIASSIASVLGVGLFAPACIVAGIAIFGAKILIDLGKARKEMAESPWSYVVENEKLK